MGKSKSGKGSGIGAKGIANIIVTVAVVAIAAGAGWYFFLRPTPEKTVTKFLDSLYAGKMDVAKTCLAEASAKDWDKNQTQISQWFKQADSADKKEKPYKIGKSEAKGTAATVQVTAPIPQAMAQWFGGKTSVDFPFACVKEKGDWRVDLAETGKQMLKSLMGSVQLPGMGAK